MTDFSAALELTQYLAKTSRETSATPWLLRSKSNCPATVQDLVMGSQERISSFHQLKLLLTCFSSSYEEVLANADSFQAWPSSRKKAGLFPSSRIGVVKHLWKICFPCIANLGHNHFCPKNVLWSKTSVLLNINCETVADRPPVTISIWERTCEEKNSTKKITLDPCTLSV